MTGVEAAGFALAILPLLISSVEHYEDVTSCFARYRQFAPEVNRYQLRLKALRVIFRNEAELLLCNVIDPGAAELMLKNASQGTTIDPVIASNFALQLGRCAEACLATVEQLKQKLEEVGYEAQGLESVVAQCKNEQCTQLGSRDWRKKLRTKLKFSLSEKHHEKNLVSLENLNNNFLTLSAQAHRMGNIESRAVESGSQRQAWDVARYSRIRGASQALYCALEKACTKHTEHSAHLCLDEKPATLNQVRFRLSFTHLTLSSSHGSDQPTWFLVESIVVDKQKEHINEPSSVMIDLAGTLKRQRTPPSSGPPKKTKRAVRFRSPSQPLPERRTPLPKPMVLGNSLTELCQRSNFCDKIRNSLQQSASTSISCLGILDRNDSWEQRVYATQNGPVSQTPKSLAHIISSFKQNASPFDLSKYQRLCIGRLLATAILQYYATPWLTESWRSEDILFFGLETANKASDSFPTAPCLNVRVKASNRVTQTSVASHGLIRNQLLFRLGVVLIELAYKAPLPALQQPCDSEEGKAIQYLEFFTARRLGELVGAKMGRPYGKIVRQCLECDFGQGHHDLNDVQLQGAVYNDIVCELQRLEDGLRSLQI